MLALLMIATSLARGPVVVGVAPDHAWITWETADSQPSGTVRFGTRAGHYDQTGVDGSDTANHHVQLTGLLPSTEYHFVIDSDAAAQDSRFTTPPAPGTRARFRFGVYGDNRTQAGPHAAVVQALQAEGPLAFLVQTGDMAENTNPFNNGWDTFFAIEHDLLRTTPFFPCVGNHETIDTLKHWSEFFAAPTFSWPLGTPKYSSMDWGQAHFVFLDTFESTLPDTEGISSAQVEWMKADLDAAKAQGQLLFAVMHHGPYSHSQHGPNPQAQQLLVPELVSRGVKAIFQGHDHVYERGCGGGLDYLLAGGGGAPLYSVDASGAGVQKAVSDYSYAVVEVDGDQVRGTAKLVDGGILETFSLPSGACSDAGIVGTPDGGPDGGQPDAGPFDAGTTDAGQIDAGQPDSGSSDAGDAGAGAITPLPASGCSCNAAPGETALALLALLAAAVRRKRKR